MAEQKLYLNIQEQVEKNKNDIKFMLEEEGTLNKFGIKVIGQEDDVSDMPSVADYKEEYEDWAYGDAYAIGTEPPYTLYILTRANGTHPNDYWFNIGQFPVPGPQGETGEEGPAGHTPQVTVATPVTNTLPAGSNASASVVNVGTSDDPRLAFTFGIPKGDKGDTGAKGDPGAFTINGQVANASLLPDASLVDSDTAYAVGTVLPYDIYVIQTEAGVQSWLNLGPIINEISDTYTISEGYATSGTLNETQLNQLLNDDKMNFVVNGGIFFCKVGILGSHLYYQEVIDNESHMIDINTSTGSWSITSHDFIDKTSDETVTGTKTFTKIITNNIESTNVMAIGNADKQSIIFKGPLVPNTNNDLDIGSVQYKLKDLYLAGKIKDGTNEFNADNVLNVINASDIVSNTLTQDQYDLITNGKPTLIKGTIFGRNNIALFPVQDIGNHYRGLAISSGTRVGTILIQKSTLEISLDSLTVGTISLDSIKEINGKTIPSYPSNTGTFVLKCVDGVLTWVAE